MSLNYAIVASDFGLNALAVQYNNESLEFDLTELYKDQSNLPTLYDKINEYVATLPEAQQKALFDVYATFSHSGLKSSFDDPESVASLELMIAQASDILNYDRFIAWNRTQSGQIIYPDNINDDYTYDPDQNTPPEKTYIRNDYTDLIGMVIFIRALSPLYIDYYNYIKENASYYYYKIFMLLVRSDVYTSPQAEKLRIYVEANRATFMGGQVKNDNLVLDVGLSDDDVLDALLAEIIFNKLLTIDFFHKKANIISFIFQTIKYKGSYTPSDGLNIRNKNVKTDASKDDISYFEDYRKTSNVVLGTSVEIQHALSSLEYLLTGLGRKHFNHEAYAYELEHHLPKLLAHRPDKTQIYILGWFLDKIINPRALYYIEPRKLIELMLFAKVIFLEDGHHFLGMFMSAIRTDEQNFFNVQIRGVINKQAVRKLQPAYHFVMEDEKTSVVEKTIAEICKEITATLWTPVATKEQIALVGEEAGSMIIPNNLNELVYNYVDYLNTSTAPEVK
jgi:hypothetical protein